MRIFINGATGFVGRHVVLELLKRGHDVVAGVRDIQSAREALGADVKLLEMDSNSKTRSPLQLTTTLEDCDAIITLAGSSIFRAATRFGLEECRRSRIDTSQAILDALQSCFRRPKVWVATSAIGVYPANEVSPPELDVLSQLCTDWEKVAMQAETLGVRVARMRLGAVLGREGQAWKQLIRSVVPKFGVVIGGGHQYFSWVHVRDVAQIYADALEDARFEGPIDVIAPEVVTQRQVVHSINQRLAKVGTLSIPKKVVEWILGPVAKVVAEGGPLSPHALQRLGYRFRFCNFEAVLSDLLNDDEVQFGPVKLEGRSSDYLREHVPRIAIRYECEVNASLDDVFAFFSRPENLGLMTPPHLRFSIKQPTPRKLGLNSTIHYRIHLGKLPMNWSSELEVWQPRRRFVDVQRKGPYACWYHEHCFESLDGGGTRVTDTVFYSLPFWSLSKLVEHWFVRRQLRDIFAFRGDVMKERFGLKGETIV